MYSLQRIAPDLSDYASQTDAEWKDMLAEAVKKRKGFAKQQKEQMESDIAEAEALTL